MSTGNLRLVCVALAAIVCHLASGCCARNSSVTALNVAVKDGASNAFICDATVIFRDEEWSEEPRNTPNAVDNSCRHHGANDRAGTYSVTISRRGFITKTVDDVEVSETLCGTVEPRALEVRLDRDPNADPEAFLPIDAGDGGGG